MDYKRGDQFDRNNDSAEEKLTQSSSPSPHYYFHRTGHLVSQPYSVFKRVSSQASKPHQISSGLNTF